MNLDKNSEEMKTVVETFVMEETSELIYDNDKLERWNAIVNELGLKGQGAVVKPEKSPIPFMYMNDNLVQIAKELCPVQVDVSEYDKTPIPLEILECIALSKKEQYFTEIQIWYDDKTKDPFCVGLKNKYYTYVDNVRTEDFDTREEAKAASNGGYVYTQDENYYLLGKWADVKRSFLELRKMAIEKYLKRRGFEIEERIKDYKRDLDELNKRAFQLFGAVE